MSQETITAECIRDEQADIDSEGLQVTCGKNNAIFFPTKLKKSGKSISKCIHFQGRWMTPPEFESLSGFHSRKWRQNIKNKGKPIGEWLSNYHKEEASKEANSQTQPIVTSIDTIPLSLPGTRESVYSYNRTCFEQCPSGNTGQCPGMFLVT